MDKNNETTICKNCKTRKTRKTPASKDIKTCWSEVKC